jgi:hypothetical protein
MWLFCEDTAFSNMGRWMKGRYFTHYLISFFQKLLRFLLLYPLLVRQLQTALLSIDASALIWDGVGRRSDGGG